MDDAAILARLAELHPRVVDLSLGRLERLLARLDNPQHRLPPVVHVAGTNGKGSTIAMLGAIQRAAGRTVHVYTSPHLVRLSERYVVADREIDPDHLTELLVRCEQANRGDSITQFEIMTAAAMLAFAETPADLLLLEVGLGGRFDATNVVDRPALSIITPVSLDHQHFLGDTLAAIAFEKAGILKSGVPAVIAAQHADALEVIMARAAECAAPTVFQGRDWSAEAVDCGLLFRGQGRCLRLPRPVLRGGHQYGNAGTAIAAALLLGRQFPVNEAALAQGLASAVWPARLQRLSRGPICETLPEGAELWVDGGHNADAGRVIAAELATWRRVRRSRSIGLVFGGLDTRSPEAYLAHFCGHADAVRTVAIPGEAHSIPADRGAEAGRSVGLACEASPDVSGAVQSLVRELGPDTAVLICGSLYLAGSVLASHG